MPQPNKHILSKGASSLIFAHDISLTTVYSNTRKHKKRKLKKQKEMKIQELMEENKYSNMERKELKNV